jgi:hypothetical protein
MFDIKDVVFECVPHATPSMPCHIMQYPYQITQTFIKPNDYCSTRDQFDTNYNIFRNVEIFIIVLFFEKSFFSKKKEKNLMEYFGNISFVEMESSKLIIYLTNMC